jgi:hypothetical protein
MLSDETIERQITEENLEPYSVESKSAFDVKSGLGRRERGADISETPDKEIRLQRLPPLESILAGKELKGRARVATGKGSILFQDMYRLLKPYDYNGIIKLPNDKSNATRLTMTRMYDIVEKHYDDMERAYALQQSQYLERDRDRQPGGDGGAGSGGQYSSSEYDLPPRSRVNADEAGYGSWGGVKQRAEGEGIRTRRKTGRGIQKGVDYSLGIDPLPKFAPVGKYYINLQKLNDDIITCCRPDGKNANQWRAQRVSQTLANLIRKLVNKHKPTFDELSELSDEDKFILGDFVRKAKIEVDIPNSKIGREDLNQFEIMKGEILSGNDSIELIKKFKLLIVKLSHQGRLPKGQAKELLLELAQLGY